MTLEETGHPRKTVPGLSRPLLRRAGHRGHGLKGRLGAPYPGHPGPSGASPVPTVGLGMSCLRGRRSCRLALPMGTSGHCHQSKVRSFCLCTRAWWENAAPGLTVSGLYLHLSEANPPRPLSPGGLWSAWTGHQSIGGGPHGPTRRAQPPCAALMVMWIRLVFRLIPHLPRAHSTSTSAWLRAPENLLPCSA